MEGLLDDLSVLDITRSVDGYAAKLLGDFGASITKIESPEGDDARRFEPFYSRDESTEASAFYSFLNMNKQSLTLDPGDPESTGTLENLFRDHEVVLETWLSEFGLSPPAVAERFPELLIVSVSGFGNEGPRRDFASTELVETAMGGLLYISGFRDRPPTNPPCYATSFLSASYAAIGAVSGHLKGLSHPENHVDVSKQECIASQLEQFELDYPLNGEIPGRNGNTHNLGHPMGEIYETVDGYVCVCLGGAPFTNDRGGTELAMWPKFCELLDRSDLLSDERFTPLEEEFGPAKRRRHADELDPILNEEIRSWTKDELFLEAQEAGLTVSRVSTSEDVVEDEQLRERNFLTRLKGVDSAGSGPIVPSSPFHVSETSIHRTEPSRLASDPTADGPGPKEVPGESDSGAPEDPLADFRVLDFTRGWSGPFSTQILADLGADVIKVETPRQLDPSRKFTPSKDNYIGDPVQGEDHSAYFQKLNRGKRGLGLDFKASEGRELVREMVRENYVDAIVENFTGGTLKKVGLDYEELRAVNPSFIMCSLSGFGQDGPYSHFPMYGPNVQAHAGVTKLNGFPDDPPVRMGISFADPFSGIHATFSVLSALAHRNRTGRGEYIDLAQLETGALITHQALSTFDLTGQIMNGRGNREPNRDYVQGVYPCESDAELDEIEGWIALSIRNQREWERFRDLLGNPDWTKNQAFRDQDRRLRHHDELDEHIEAWTRERERYDLMDRLQGAGIPAGVVQTTADLYDRDEHLEERGFWSEMEHPLIPTIPYPGPIPSPGRAGDDALPRAPFFAEHTRDILGDLEKYDDAEVEDLLESGVLFTQ